MGLDTKAWSSWLKWDTTTGSLRKRTSAKFLGLNIFLNPSPMLG